MLYVRLQVTLLKAPVKFLIGKIRAFLEMEAEYKFLAKIITSKLPIPRGDK